MAPEVLAAPAKPYDGFKADMWGLGVLLYCMLTGEQPFRGDDVASTLAQVAAAQYECPWRLSKNAKQLIQGLMAAKPSDRMSLVDVLCHPWVRQARVDDPPKPLHISGYLDRMVQAPDLLWNACYCVLEDDGSTLSFFSNKRHRITKDTRGMTIYSLQGAVFSVCRRPRQHFPMGYYVLLNATAVAGSANTRQIVLRLASKYLMHRWKSALRFHSLASEVANETKLSEKADSAHGLHFLSSGSLPDNLGNPGPMQKVALKEMPQHFRPPFGRDLTALFERLSPATPRTHTSIRELTRRAEQSPFGNNLSVRKAAELLQQTILAVPPKPIFDPESNRSLTREQIAPPGCGNRFFLLSARLSKKKGYLVYYKVGLPPLPGKTGAAAKPTTSPSPRPSARASSSASNATLDLPQSARVDKGLSQSGLQKSDRARKSAKIIVNEMPVGFKPAAKSEFSVLFPPFGAKGCSIRHAVKALRKLLRSGTPDRRRVLMAYADVPRIFFLLSARLTQRKGRDVYYQVRVDDKEAMPAKPAAEPPKPTATPAQRLDGVRQMLTFLREFSLLPPGAHADIPDDGSAMIAAGDPDEMRDMFLRFVPPFHLELLKLTDSFSDRITYTAVKSKLLAKFGSAVFNSNKELVHRWLQYVHDQHRLLIEDLGRDANKHRGAAQNQTQVNSLVAMANGRGSTGLRKSAHPPPTPPSPSPAPIYFSEAHADVPVYNLAVHGLPEREARPRERASRNPPSAPSNRTEVHVAPLSDVTGSDISTTTDSIGDGRHQVRAGHGSWNGFEFVPPPASPATTERLVPDIRHPAP